ncbi:MAG: PP2C family protein-serine/threonine phosphatase [Hyphomicrobiaceae bacterium]
MSHFEYAYRAIQGARNYQEDAAVVHPQTTEDATAELVVALADGMGGHAGGAVASKIVCDSFVRCFRALESTPKTGHPAASIREKLSTALNDANYAVGLRAHDEPGLSGMGSTLIGAELSQEGLHWVSVGDSPLLLVRDGEAVQVNADHSLAPELDRLAELGEITLEQAQKSSHRNMLRSAITGDEIDLIDLSRMPLQLIPNDYVLFASDGLQTLDNQEIARIVSAFGADGPDAVSAALLREVEAMREPHQDNATVVAIRVLASN